MFVSFFEELRNARVPVSLREYLTLLEAVEGGVVPRQTEQFYFLARACLVKDERFLDRFDQVFAHVFQGLDAVALEDLETAIPDEWLKSISQLYLSEEEKKQIEELGGFEKIMETLKKRLEEQKERHSGGNKWIGTGGTSPFGADGYNPAGVRIGQRESRHRRAVKVWDKREFKDFADDVELGTRNIKVALRKLRKFARTGAADELDLDATISSTANKGYVDVKMQPERRNAVRVLMFLDVGGSMDWHVKEAEELFSAARSEFKHLETYYFHNCLYEYVWQENARRWGERTPTWDVLHTYSSDYKVIFVGDAAMSPYEVSHIGGSVEHMNEEAGATWLSRVCSTFSRVVWLNPTPESYWPMTPSVGMISKLLEGRMYPLTLGGLEEAIGELKS